MDGEKTEMRKSANSKHALILSGFGFHVKISDCIQCWVLILICLSHALSWPLNFLVALPLLPALSFSDCT